MNLVPAHPAVLQKGILTAVCYSHFLFTGTVQKILMSTNDKTCSYYRLLINRKCIKQVINININQTVLPQRLLMWVSCQLSLETATPLTHAMQAMLLNHTETIYNQTVCLSAGQTEISSRQQNSNLAKKSSQG